MNFDSAISLHILRDNELPQESDKNAGRRYYFLLIVCSHLSPVTISRIAVPILTTLERGKSGKRHYAFGGVMRWDTMSAKNQNSGHLKRARLHLRRWRHLRNIRRGQRKRRQCGCSKPISKKTSIVRAKRLQRSERKNYLFDQQGPKSTSATWWFAMIALVPASLAALPFLLVGATALAAAWVTLSSTMMILKTMQIVTGAIVYVAAFMAIYLGVAMVQCALASVVMCVTFAQVIVFGPVVLIWTVVRSLLHDAKYCILSPVEASAGRRTQLQLELHLLFLPYLPFWASNIFITGGMAIARCMLVTTIISMTLVKIVFFSLGMLTWLILVSLLSEVNEYILTPPSEERTVRGTRAQHYLSILCLSFCPCWAVTGPSRITGLDFECKSKSCNYSTHLPPKMSDCKPQDQGLWQALHADPKKGEEHCCTVTCPGCKKELIQCRHCTINSPTDLKSIAKFGRNPIGYFVTNHFKQKHKNMASKDDDDEGQQSAKRQRQNSPSIDTTNSQQASGILEAFAHAANAACGLFDCGGGDNASLDEEMTEARPNVDAIIADDSSCVSAEEEQDWNMFDVDYLEQLLNKENAAMDEQDKQAVDFVNEFNGMDLDSSSVLEDAFHDMHWNNEELHNEADNGWYSYSDFVFLDWRESKEKLLWAGTPREREMTCQTQLYFYQKYLAKKRDPSNESGGFEGLVHRSNVRNREDTSPTAPKEEAHQAFLLLTLLIHVPGKLKDRLLNLQANFYKLFNISQIRHGVKTRFPTDMAQARAMYLDGAHSIMKNFPSPRVFEIEGHACVSLKETIMLAAGHGAKFNFAWNPHTANKDEDKRNKEGLNGTKAVDDLLEDCREAMKEDDKITPEEAEKTSIGWIYFWSDSFLRCFIKQKDNSVWILTVTICPPESEKSSGRYTHVLAMGKSSEDHTPVIERYLEEYIGLMKGFKCYFGASNDIRRMAVSMLAWNADRPERQMISNTRKEGTYGKISGWAANVSQEKFPACHQCYARLLREMIPGLQSNEDLSSPPCRQCFNWELNPGDSRQETDEVDSDYPVYKPWKGDEDLEGRNPGKALLGPVKLSTKFLRDALTKAYNARQSGVWAKKDIFSFLRTCNVKADRIEIVDKIAEEDKKKNQISDPSTYEPKVWSLVDCFARFRLPNMPMHGLAHGIIPDVMDIIHKILAHYKKFTAFVNFANETLEQIVPFRLDYCKVKTLPKAAWVGENSMAYMRLFSYLYGMFLLNTPLSSNEGETRNTVSNLKCMLNALQALISVLMSKSIVDEKIINNHMKLFMSSAHFLHTKYGRLARDESATSDQGANSNSTRSDKNLVGKLGMEAVRAALKVFGLSEKKSEKQSRIALGKVTNKDLKAELQKRHMKTSGTKPTLQARLFENIIGHSVDGAQEIHQEGPSTNPKQEDRCWFRGNWLSFMAEIAAQIQYLGPLHLLW